MSENQFPSDIFKTGWDAFARVIYENAKAKGFHAARHTDHTDSDIRHLSDMTAMALIVSEIAEAIEGLRAGNPKSEKIGMHGFSQVEEELADAVIRIMDAAYVRGWNIPGAIYAKVVYNNNRPLMHGGKKS